MDHLLSPVELYERQVRELSEDCADPWFNEQIGRYRTGHEDALRNISERCLGRVLEIAKKHWRPDSEIDLLDAVQEGNAALVQAIRQFPGSTSDDFLRQMAKDVEVAVRKLF